MSKKHNISDHSECFAEDILIKYINDELSIEESDAVEKHLSGCEICSDFVDGVLMLESTESFLTAKEDLNQAITSNINKTSRKRKLNPYMFRAVAAVALILVICGTYFIIDLLINDKKINQIQKENEIVQTVKENEETEMSVENNDIAQTISETKETEKDEILKFHDSGLLDIYDKSGNLSEKDLKSGEEDINEEITKVLVTDNETITSSYNVITDGVKDNNGENYNYYGGISNVLPEETVTKSSGDYKLDKSEQSPSVVEDLTVISARDEKDSRKENRRQDKDNEGINSGVSKQKESVNVETEVGIARNKEERSSDGDINYNTGNVVSAPAGNTTDQETANSNFETISFANIEEKPVFPGGYEALIKFIEENTNYPESEDNLDASVKILVSFIIDTAGYVTNVTVLKGLNPEYDTEAVRVIKMLPRWTPGKLNGKPVNVSFVYPVDFKNY